MIVEEIQNNPDTLIEMEEGELKFDSGMKNNSKFKNRKISNEDSDSESKISNSPRSSLSDRSLISSVEKGDFKITYIPIEKKIENSDSDSSGEIKFKEIKGRNIKIDADSILSSEEKKKIPKKEIQQKIKFPTCRYLYVIGRCDLGKECKFNHKKLKTRDELDKFLEDNLDFLIDFYRAGTLKRLLFPFHDFLRRKSEKDQNFLIGKKIQLMKPEPEKVPLEEILNVTYNPKKSPNKKIIMMKGGVPVKPPVPFMMPTMPFNPPQHPQFIPIPQNYPLLGGQMLQNPVHNIQNVHNQQIFISPQPNQNQPQIGYHHPNQSLMYNPNMFFYPPVQQLYNPLTMQPTVGLYLNHGNQIPGQNPNMFMNNFPQQHLQQQKNNLNPIFTTKKIQKKQEGKKKRSKKRTYRSRSRERDKIKAKKKRREKSRDRKRKKRRKRSNNSSKSSKKGDHQDKEKILSLLKKVDTGIEKNKPIKDRPLLKPDDPRRATIVTSSSESEPLKKKERSRSRSKKRKSNRRKIKNSRKRKRKNKNQSSSSNSRKVKKSESKEKDKKTEQKRRNLLDKKFKLLFDKNFKEDKKKVEAVKEEIKKEELKYKKKKSDKGKISAEKLGKEFDISEETSEEENKFSEDDDNETIFPHLIN